LTDDDAFVLAVGCEWEEQEGEQYDAIVIHSRFQIER
jgi:hypothetical protein